MNHLKPLQPDPYLKKASDMTPAKFGHLNHVIDLVKQINDKTMQPATGIRVIDPFPDYTPVPATFEDLAAVNTYLVDVVDKLSTDIDTLRYNLDNLLSVLKDAGIMEPAWNDPGV